MNGDFGTAEVAEVGTFQVAKVPENRYNYTIPKLHACANSGSGTLFVKLLGESLKLWRKSLFSEHTLGARD